MHIGMHPKYQMLTFIRISWIARFGDYGFPLNGMRNIAGLRISIGYRLLKMRRKAAIMEILEAEMPAKNDQIDVIKPENLRKEPLHLDIAIPEGSIDYAPDIRQLGDLHISGQAEVIEEHGDAGGVIEDIRVRAKFDGRFELLCARCLEPSEQDLKGEFDLIFRPSSVDARTGERAISEAETEIGYYEESGLVLEDVVREQVLLSLPDRLLCKPDCKGLCPQCGQNLNEASCHCDNTTSDPRWNALKDLAGSIGQPKE